MARVVRARAAVRGGARPAGAACGRAGVDCGAGMWGGAGGLAARRAAARRRLYAVHLAWTAARLRGRSGVRGAETVGWRWMGGLGDVRGSCRGVALNVHAAADEHRPLAAPCA